MKISEKFAQAHKEDRIVWSFEYFPPRTAQGLKNLYDRIERMRLLGPEFVDITWGAGGKNSDLTLSLVQTCQETIGVETCMHLCCTESDLSSIIVPEEKVKEALRVAKAHGCQNILALRGDPPNGQSTWTPTPGGFMQAIDLVKYIRSEYGDYFDVAVAGFPQGHPETSPGAAGRSQEIEWLKEKIDAGANFIFTQMFYDADIFISWVKDVRAAGITVPIVPGIMPIQSWQKFTTWVQRESIVVPPKFYDVLLPVQGDDEKVRAVGTKLVAEMCQKILAADIGIHCLHVYTLNLEKGATMLLEELGLEGRREQLQPYPWRPSLTPNRRQESIRPIFWANRPDSYLSRTDSWDEFPNGRWGDSRSPAYGDLDGYPVTININRKDAHELWGYPETMEDICKLFADFCRNQLRALPWSTQPASKETSVIDQQLAKMNEMGFLTINSQPAVDGARSDDPTHGWGPKSGYVYQKAYLEFFVAPNLLDDLVKRIERDPRITYYAVNRQGDLRTNTHSEGPNAVTWGVFPGKEIVQPTIVEAISFIAWKDEAFELGMQWANLYDEGSASRKLISEIMDNSYLVNIVANDFRDGPSIFEPFQLDSATAPVVISAAAKAVNGAAHVAVDTVTSVVSKAAETVQAVVAPKAAETNGVLIGPEPKPKKTMKDLEHVFNSTPLFMREAPEAGSEANNTLDALKSLVFDGTGDEIATNFKDNGNELHLAGQHREALEAYTQGIAAKPEDERLLISLLLNRAACNLVLGNYGSVIKDTSAVIEKSPQSAKAFYRASTALLALSKWDEAVDCIARGKALPSETGVETQKMWRAQEVKAEAGLRKVEEAKERVRREMVGKEALKRAFQARGIITKTTATPPDNPSPAGFDTSTLPEPLPLYSGPNPTEKWYPPAPSHSVIFPVFFLYPTHANSDIITRFHEDSTFGDQLAAMFPSKKSGPTAGEPEWAFWDQERKYYCDNMVIYVETSTRKLLKVGKSLTLYDVLEKAAALEGVNGRPDGLVLQDGLFSFVVLAKGQEERSWVETFKSSRDSSS